MCWAHEQVDISAYAGKEVKFRFWMRYDNFVNGDGFYFDDFEVTAIMGVITGAYPNTDDLSGLFLSEAYPNPASGSFKVQYRVQPGHDAYLELMDTFGKRLLLRPLSEQEGVLTIGRADLAPGMYLYRLVSGTQSSAIRKVIVR